MSDNEADGWFRETYQMILEDDRYRAGLDYAKYVELLEDDSIYDGVPMEWDWEMAEQWSLTLGCTPSELLEENAKIIEDELPWAEVRHKEVERQRSLRALNDTPTFWELLVWEERGAPSGDALPVLPPRSTAA